MKPKAFQILISDICLTKSCDILPKKVRESVDDSDTFPYLYFLLCKTGSLNENIIRKASRNHQRILYAKVVPCTLQKAQSSDCSYL